MALPKIKSITDLKKETTKTIEAVNKGEIHIITHKSGDVVMIPREAFDDMMERAQIMSDFKAAQADDDTGNLIDHNEIVTSMKKKYEFLNENKMVKKSQRKSR